MKFNAGIRVRILLSSFLSVLSFQSVTFAASPELNGLLYNRTVRSTSTNVRDYSRTLVDCTDAYTSAWIEFNQIIIPGSLGAPKETTVAGPIYPGTLKGGGTGEVRLWCRTGGGFIPTIGIRNHNTMPHPKTKERMSNIIEIKFKYSTPYCPVSTNSSCK
jgi:hypothetical protein